MPLVTVWPMEDKIVNWESLSRSEPESPDLNNLLVGELEQMLVHMLIVKYPGIEQADIERLLKAIRIGDLERIGQTEADMAHKSARWMLAALDIDQQWVVRDGPYSLGKDSLF